MIPGSHGMEKLHYQLRFEKMSSICRTGFTVDCEVTTVGYGDQTLFRPESRAFAAVFVVLSFMVVGATLGQVGAVLVDLEVQRREQAMMATKLSPQLLARMDFDGNGVTMAVYSTPGGVRGWLAAKV